VQLKNKAANDPDLNVGKYMPDRRRPWNLTDEKTQLQKRATSSEACLSDGSSYNGDNWEGSKKEIKGDE